MIQVRYNMFETNSSSTCSFIVHVIQTDHLDIPAKVEIESSNEWWKQDINGCYSNAQHHEQEKEFVNFLASKGVKEIYVDGKLQEIDPENDKITFRDPDEVLAICFGEYFGYSEWFGHDGEAGESTHLTKKQIKKIQDYSKKPDFSIVCYDGEDGPQIPWESHKYSKWVITEEDIEKEEKQLALAHEYEQARQKEMYNEYESVLFNKEDDDYDDTYDGYKVDNKSRYNRKKRY